MLEVMGRVGLWKIPTARGQVAAPTRKERRRTSRDEANPHQVSKIAAPKRARQASLPALTPKSRTPDTST
jgi:hypothetical protein